MVAYDPYPNPKVQELGVPYLPLDDAISQAHVVTLHVPLLKDTFHIINAERCVVAICCCCWHMLTC